MDTIKQQRFIKKCLVKYGTRYDYSKFEYEDAKTASTIICPVHGEFRQKPDHHLRKDAIGCQACALEKKIERFKNMTPEQKGVKEHLSADEFLSRATERYGNKFSYDMTNYHGLTANKIAITCPIHGEHEYVPQAHLISKTGCKFCGVESSRIKKTKSFNDLQQEVSSLYNGHYSLPDSNRDTFVNRKSIVSVSCPKHGIFYKNATKLLSGQGCFQCTIEALVEDGRLPGGYCDELFDKTPELKEQPAVIYYLSINKCLYKIGISVIGTSSRVRALRYKAKGSIHSVTILEEVETTLYAAYKLEQRLLAEYSDNRKYKGWSTELFDIDVLQSKSLADLL